MESIGLLATLHAKQGKEQELSDMLKGALELAQAEEKTVSWYSFQINETIFGVFDTFENEEGRDAHLNGDIAAALMAKADELLSRPPLIEKVQLLAVK